MDALLSLIPGGSLTAIAAAVVAALLGAWRIYAAGKKSQRAKEDEARLRAIQDKKGIDHEVDTLGSDQLVDRFRRWVRDQ